MRHGRKVNHLGRTASHRKAMLSNLATSLILSKRITTTVAKAKALRKYVEPLITKAKADTQHSRRTVFSYLQNKESVKELFGTVVSRTSERAGGYTRIIKMGDVRLGDNAEMCLIELVDFNEIYKKDGDAKKGKTRRGRTKAKKAETTEVVAESVEKPAAEAKAEKPARKTAKKSTPKKEKE
jgi:large subunit ribosomal protein L17